MFSTEDIKVARALVELLSGAPKTAGIKDFADFTDHLKRAGLGQQLQAWIAGKEMRVSAEQLQDALSDTQAVEFVQKRTALPAEDVLDRLTWVLPRVLHEVKPFGEDEAPDAVFLHLDGLRTKLRA